jgi:hypothetical protein
MCDLCEAIMVFWQPGGKRHGLQSRGKVFGVIGRKKKKRIEAFSIDGLIGSMPHLLQVERRRCTGRW